MPGNYYSLENHFKFEEKYYLQAFEIRKKIPGKIRLKKPILKKHFYSGRFL
jgi:hypothetical protein